MTHYEVLGVEPGAHPDQVRAAYVALARRYHPDVAGGDAGRMRAINQAWATLRDPVRRARYDATLRASSRPRTAPSEPAVAREVDDEVDDPALLADLADDSPIGAVVVLPRWLSLVPVASFAAAVGSFCIGLVLAMPWLLAVAVATFLLSCVLFLAAPFVALYASRRGYVPPARPPRR